MGTFGLSQQGLPVISPKEFFLPGSYRQGACHNLLGKHLPGKRASYRELAQLSVLIPSPARVGPYGTTLGGGENAGDIGDHAFARASDACTAGLMDPCPLRRAPCKFYRNTDRSYRNFRPGKQVCRPNLCLDQDQRPHLVKPVLSRQTFLDPGPKARPSQHGRNPRRSQSHVQAA